MTHSGQICSLQKNDNFVIIEYADGQNVLKWVEHQMLLFLWLLP